jgi:hypothetical protein
MYNVVVNVAAKRTLFYHGSDVDWYWFSFRSHLTFYLPASNPMKLGRFFFVRGHDRPNIQLLFTLSWRWHTFYELSHHMLVKYDNRSKVAYLR